MSHGWSNGRIIEATVIVIGAVLTEIILPISAFFSCHEPDLMDIVIIVSGQLMEDPSEENL